MSDAPRTRADEVDHLLRNAQLRDELEPFLDESIYQLNVAELPTPVENEFLASMLAWERAPVVPISQWFAPELVLPHPNSLSDEELHDILWDTIQKLYDKRIVLDFTDHLSDRQLYRLIYCDILPSPEKKIDRGENYLHWDCAGASDDPDVWLRYYASEAERLDWFESTHEPLPPIEPPPFPRQLPRQPL
jgi:hypothetical protein